MVDTETLEGGFCLMRCRWLASLLLVLLLAATACSQPVRKVQPQEAASRTLKVVVPKGHTVTEGLVAGFRQAYSNVTIELLPLDTSSYDAQARSYAAGDVVLFNPTTPPAGLLDLSPYMVRDRIDEDAYGMALKVLRNNGTLTGLPIRVESLMLLYNKEMTEAAGVTIPAGGWTWDEFRAVAARLVRQDLKGTVPAMGNRQNDLLLDLYLEQKTGRPAWETDEQTLTDALAYFHTLIHTDRSLQPYSGNPRDGANPLAVTDAFKGGEVALSGGLQGQIKLAERPFAWDIAPLPHHSPKNRLTLGFYDVLGITTGAADPELAWDFVAWAGGPEGARQLAQAGYLPVYHTPDWDSWLKATYPQAPQAIYSVYETKFVPLRMLEGDAVAKNRALDRAVSRVFSGTASVEAAVADWKRDLGLQ